MKRTIGLVALSLSGVQAARWSAPENEKSWRPAQATMAAMPLLDGTTPRPTAAPGQPFDLKRRGAKDNTCGYVDGLTGSAFGCATTAECIYNSLFSVIGCCPDSSTACPIPTTCFDYTESVSFTSTNKNDLYCSGTAYPSCIQHLYADETFDNYIFWDCARDSGRTDTVYYLPLTTDSTSKASSSSTSSSTGSQVATLTSQTASATTPVVTGSSKPDPDEGNKKSTPVGAIVGGVVGGVAAIALLATALFFILRKKKQPAQTPPPAAATAAPGQPGSPGYYDPNQPQMAQQQPGQYGYPQGGFVPVDPRASIAKPPYAVQQNAYDPNQPPQQFSSPGSPAPAYGYNGVGTPPPAGFTPSPQPGEYAQQPYQAQQYNPNGQPGHGQVAQSPPPAHATSFAAELPAHRGDGELRELA